MLIVLTGIEKINDFYDDRRKVHSKEKDMKKIYHWQITNKMYFWLILFSGIAFTIGYAPHQSKRYYADYRFGRNNCRFLFRPDARNDDHGHIFRIALLKRCWLLQLNNNGYFYKFGFMLGITILIITSNLSAYLSDS